MGYRDEVWGDSEYPRWLLMLTNAGRSPPYDPTYRLCTSLELSAKEVAAVAQQTSSTGSPGV